MTDREPKPWRERIARPLLMLGLISGAVIFLPRLARHEVKLVPQVKHVDCAKYARVSVSQDGERLRSFKVLHEEGRFDGHTVKLAEGEYLVHTSLECNDGATTEPEPQPLIVDRAGAVYLRVRGRCACS